MTTSSWSPGRRIAFRFGFLMAAFITLPFPISLLPKTQWLNDLYAESWQWGARGLATLIGLADPPVASNGSGDRTIDYLQVLLFAIIAVLSTVVWSIADRRRTSYPRLAAATVLVLRYSLAYWLLIYGIIKIAKSQFPDPLPGRLVEPVGDVSPMGLLWTFMSYSLPYTVFAGLLEAIAGTLLVWRRTVTLGAVMAAAVMFNVVMLNFCYDVPVKLFSIQLVVTAVVIAAPRVRALIAVFLGRSAPEAPERPRMSLRRERARLIAKIAILALMAWSLYRELAGNLRRNDRLHELQDLWVVDSFTLDGVERTSAIDPERWQRVAINRQGIWLVNMLGRREGMEQKVDAEKHEITVDLDDEILDKDRPKTKDGKPEQEIWTYQRSAPDRLEIDGVHRGKRFHAAMHLAPPSRLMTRGFHWINEEPFNR
jgi:uncharacterized membrane protein YphA (DoxX/SURF4 family)